MVSLVAVGLALALAYLLGAHRARERERARLARGQIEPFEADLLRAQGKRRHPNPEAAPVVSRMVIKRIAAR